MTIKKLVEQLVRERFPEEETRDLALKLVRATKKNEIKELLDGFAGDHDDRNG